MGMGLMNKILLLLILLSGFLLIFYANINYLSDLFRTSSLGDNSPPPPPPPDDDGGPVVGAWRGRDEGGRHQPHPNSTTHNLFVIYTKETPLLQRKYEMLLKSLFKYTASILVHLHVITDARSTANAEQIARAQMLHYGRRALVTMLDVEDCVQKVNDIVQAMMPHFSSHPGSYYSDALFYLSLGLHRIADPKMRRGILLDCDVVFRADAKLLFDQFRHFGEENLFGLAPELTPVYRHILYRYRAQHPDTSLGAPYYPFAEDRAPGRVRHGYPGLNSGVVLLDFGRMRASSFYAEILEPEQVQRLVQKYRFRGHLGDQDFYTVLGYEFPSLVYRLDCAWNRQLCLWWKDHGYSDVFDTYFHCEGRIRVYHGNCNSRIPE